MRVRNTTTSRVGEITNLVRVTTSLVCAEGLVNRSMYAALVSWYKE